MVGGQAVISWSVASLALLALISPEAAGQATSSQSSRQSGQSGQNTSGVSASPQLGTVGQQQLTGLGAARIDRSGRNAVSPLSTRGTESLRGVESQQAGSRQTNMSLLRGPLFGTTSGYGFGASQFGVRSTRTDRPQYIVRLQLAGITEPARARPTVPAMPEAGERIRKAVASLPGAQQVQVTLDSGSTVVLRGIVATDRERRLAELMAKLQAGVKQVKNELRVQESRTKATEQGR